MNSDTPLERLAILPQPVSVARGEGAFLLTRDTVIVTEPQTYSVGTQLAAMLTPVLGYPLVVVNEAPAGQPAIWLSIGPELARLGKEGYQLTVMPERITLRSSDPAGVFYPAQTLRQVLPLAG